MFRHLTDILRAWGPPGILLFSILDSVGLPLGPLLDAWLMGTAAASAAAGWLGAALAVAGSTVGNIVLFWSARKGGRGFMENAPPTGRAARFGRWFRRYGLLTVFIPALLPIPMPLKFFVISAGVTGTALWQFAGVVITARALRYFGEAWLGSRLGLEPAAFLKAQGMHFIEGAVVLFLLLYGLIRWRDRGERGEVPL